MKTYTIKKHISSKIKKGNKLLKAGGAILASLIITTSSPIRAQAVLFSFDDIPVYTPFPITHTVSGITAHFSGTGSSYSIQAANVLGFTPAGFSGNVVYPSSINASDLLISFDQKITDFSIMYSVQELGCDTSATMEVRGYLKGAQVVTSYTIAAVPGTWPVDTLKCSLSTGFDSAVVHFYSHPSRCADWGPIFLADNMKVTAYPSGIASPQTFIERLIIPNPVSQSSTISFSISQPEDLK